MPENLYEASNEFRLYDVEGVILDNPNDYIVIREPDNFKEAGIKLNRDKKSHGFDYEFSDSEAPYGFDRVKFPGETLSPYDVLLGIFSFKGVDGRAVIRFYRNAVLQYEGDIDFSTIKIVDYKITATSRRINLDDLFRTRFETPVDFSATESIDGTTITGLTPESMFMHSKEITENVLTEIIPNDGFASAGFNASHLTGTTYTVGSARPFNPTLNNLKGSDGSDSFDQQLEFVTPFGISNTFKMNDDGYFTYDADSPVYRFTGFYFMAQENFTYSYEVNVKLKGDFRISGRDGFLTVYLCRKVGSTIYKSEIYSETSLDGVDTAFDVSKIVFVNKPSTEEDFTEMYLECDLPRINNINNSGFRVRLDPSSDNQFNVESIKVSENSFSDVYNPFDSFNHILEVINDGTNLLISDFWSNIGDEIYLTNGYKLRLYEDRPVLTDFKTLFEKWAQPVFGLGFAIFNDSGDFKVLMERYDHFYQDVEIDAITAIESDSFEISIDKELIFNEIKIGYKEFAKSTDENKGNNIEAFNSEQSLLTPIETVKKKKDYISDIIADGYKIENQRIEQFKEVPSKTVTDDDKIFSVKGRTEDDYTDLRLSFIKSVTSFPDIIDINAAYLNLSVGDVITISDTVSNNGTFTIETITDDLEGNINFLDGVRLVVTESTTLEEDVSGVTITKSAAFLRAERDEAFVSILEVNNKTTVYNVGLNPKYMLYNQSLLLNSGFTPKPDTTEIKTRDAKLNSKMNCKFKTGEGEYILDPDNEFVYMDGDIELRRFNSYNRLFNGTLIKFTTFITYDRVLSIRDACLNQDGLKDYGYISVTAPNGDVLRGFIMSMVYNPLSEKTDFVLRQQFDPIGESFDHVLDFPTT